MSTNQPDSLELYLFPSCPFAQRVQMNLIRSGLNYSKNVFKPDNMPDNFNEISPLGNVPVLLVNGNQSIFESAVIADYVAQISPVSLEPEDEVSRAQMRAWCGYSDSLFSKLMATLKAETKEDMQNANKELISSFDILSTQLKSNGPFFFGEQYTTIDSTYAPIFLRIKILSEIFPEFNYQALPENVQKWMEALLESDTLQQSIIGNFPDVLKMFINFKAGTGYINKHL